MRHEDRAAAGHRLPRGLGICSPKWTLAETAGDADRGAATANHGPRLYPRSEKIRPRTMMYRTPARCRRILDFSSESRHGGRQRLEGRVAWAPPKAVADCAVFAKNSPFTEGQSETEYLSYRSEGWRDTEQWRAARIACDSRVRRGGMGLSSAYVDTRSECHVFVKREGTNTAICLGPIVSAISESKLTPRNKPFAWAGTVVGLGQSNVSTDFPRGAALKRFSKNARRRWRGPWQSLAGRCGVLGRAFSMTDGGASIPRGTW